ncbi:hypothetical protein GPK60_00990, partial [Ruminococcus sp. MCC718]|nr:hypothetical protein [Ruminococcus sp. MCC718]
VSPVEVAATDELPYPNMAAFYNNEKQKQWKKTGIRKIGRWIFRICHG